MSGYHGRLALLLALAALAAALLFTCPGGDDVGESPESEVALHPNVLPKRIDAPGTHWRDSGFVKMVPPVRLPSDQAGADRIVVWLKVGDGTIGARQADDGRVLLSYPPGTVADRVESMGDAVIDVRGTTLERDGAELFHVYVAEHEAPSALVGWEWRRGDFDAEASATRALLAQLDKTRRKMRGQPAPSKDQHQASLVSYERNNNCGACHAHERPLVTSGDGVHRPTDSAGFFVPLSVLAPAVPLERHRPWDMNVDDPFLSLTCPSGGTPRLVTRVPLRHYACPTFEVPMGALDVDRALAAGDERTLAMCESRRYLYKHMDDDARALFAGAFAECGIDGDARIKRTD